MARSFLIFFTLFWSGIVLMFDGVLTRGLYKQIESRHYPSVEGIVTHSEVRTHHSSKGGASYDAFIQYQFQMNGQTFDGHKLRFSITSSSHGSAAREVETHPVGSPVRIFYNPANPQESLLHPGIMGSDFMMFLFLTPFNMVMLGLWIGIGAWLREHLFRPVAGGVKIVNDGMTMRLRLPQMPAMIWGMGATGILGFASIFAIGIPTSMRPSITLVISTMVFICLAGVAVYVWQKLKINSGIDDLIINLASRSFELPLTFGRKQRLSVNIADIQSLYVQKVEHRSSKGGISYTYAPTLQLRGREPATQKLADWGDQMKAGDFTEWLRQQLGPNIPASYISVPDEVTTGETIDNSPTDSTPANSFYDEAKSSIKISDGPKGREFFFPAARNLGAAIFTTVLFAAFSGGVYAMAIHHLPVVFPAGLGFFAMILGLAAFGLWFKSSRVAVDSTAVTATNRWLIFSRQRRFDSSEVVRFESQPGSTSGGKTYYNVKLITRDQRERMNMARTSYQPSDSMSAVKLRLSMIGGVTMSSGIASKIEADWVAKQMTRALGHEVATGQ